MGEALKDRLIVILGILSAILFVGTIGSCSNAYRQKIGREREMAIRLGLEEKMSKFSQEKTAIEDKLKALENELEEEKAALAATKKALVQEQLINQSLKEELSKVTKLKEALEEDLKDALVHAKSEKSKRQ